jgi:malate synthase
MKRPNNKIIIKALEENCSILVNTAQTIGCSRQQLKTWIDRDPELTAGYNEGKERFKDLVEHQMLKNIKEGKEASLIFYAKTKMRDRGFIEKQDMNMTIDAIKIKYIIPTEDPGLLTEGDQKQITE